jgi:hypothetical protein
VVVAGIVVGTWVVVGAGLLAGEPVPHAARASMNAVAGPIQRTRLREDVAAAMVECVAARVRDSTGDA